MPERWISKGSYKMCGEFSSFSDVKFFDPVNTLRSSKKFHQYQRFDVSNDLQCSTVSEYSRSDVLSAMLINSIYWLRAEFIITKKYKWAHCIKQTTITCNVAILNWSHSKLTDKERQVCWLCLDEAKHCMSFVSESIDTQQMYGNCSI